MCVWKEREERLCRVCGREEEGWEHVLERCERGDEKWEMKNKIHKREMKILAGDGSGER